MIQLLILSEPVSVNTKGRMAFTTEMTGLQAKVVAILNPQVLLLEGLASVKIIHQTQHEICSVSLGWVSIQSYSHVNLSNQEIVLGDRMAATLGFLAHPVDVGPKQKLGSQILCNCEGYGWDGIKKKINSKEINCCHVLVCISGAMQHVRVQGRKYILVWSSHIISACSSIAFAQRVVCWMTCSAMPLWWCALVPLKLIVCWCKASYSWNSADLKTPLSPIVRLYQDILYSGNAFKFSLCHDGLTIIKWHLMLNVNKFAAMINKNGPAIKFEGILLSLQYWATRQECLTDTCQHLLSFQGILLVIWRDICRTCRIRVLWPCFYWAWSQIRLIIAPFFISFLKTLCICFQPE